MKKIHIKLLLFVPLFMSSCLAGVIGGGVAVVGVATYVRGELVSHEGAPYQKCLDSVLKAMDELGYEVKDVKKSSFWYYQETVKARTEDNKKVRITVKWKAKNHTKLIIKVGTLGDKALSQKILDTAKNYIYN